MADEGIRPHGYFDRFAREVRPLNEDNGAPPSILLDLWELLDIADETRQDRAWSPAKVEELLDFETCCEIESRQEDENTPAQYFFSFGPYEIEVRYHYRDTIPSSGRYSLTCDDLNSDVVDADAETGSGLTEVDNTAFGRPLGASLTRLINRDQAFRIWSQ